MDWKVDVHWLGNIDGILIHQITLASLLLDDEDRHEGKAHVLTAGNLAQGFRAHKTNDETVFEIAGKFARERARGPLSLSLVASLHAQDLTSTPTQLQS